MGPALELAPTSCSVCGTIPAFTFTIDIPASVAQSGGDATENFYERATDDIERSSRPGDTLFECGATARREPCH